MIIFKDMFYLLVLVGVLGLLAYVYGPNSTSHEGSFLIIKLSKIKSSGLFFMLLAFTLILLQATIILCLSLSKLTGVRLDYVLGIVALIFIIAINIICFFIFFNYLSLELSRSLCLDLQAKKITINSKTTISSKSYQYTHLIKRVSGKWNSFINPINLFEYIEIGDDLIITSLLIDIDLLLEILQLHHFDTIQKWITIIKK
jgi:hypothetical protein